MGNVANIQSARSRKSSGKAQYVSSGQDDGKARSVRNENVLTRQLPEAAIVLHLTKNVGLITYNVRRNR